MSSELARLVQIALSHQHAGRLSIAFGLFEDILKRDPNNAQANFTLGIAAYQAGDIGLAIARLNIAADKAPKHPQVHQLLGLALLNAGDLKSAQKSLKKAILLSPNVADFHAQLGDLYTRKRQPDLARASFEAALKIEANNGYALIGMGQLEVSVGNIEDAVTWFELAISQKKELPAAYQFLTMTRTYQSRPEELSQIEELLKNVAQANTEKSNLHWAAGKIYYDIGDTERAVQHYHSARKLRYSDFDQVKYEERMAFMKEVFDKNFFSSRLEFGDKSKRPVFIFGMPRSGTTLAEQIISRHSHVASGAEISYFRHLQQDLGLTRAPSTALETRLKSMEARDFKTFAKGYLSVLNDVDKRADRVTDKMPHNYEMLWLMSLLFPNAAFVHCCRCPADTCISLLSHALSPAHSYCLTQQSVGRYFHAYANLMEHWQQVLPVQLHRLSYEKLVDDQLGESHKLLEQCGLEWEEECLEFYKGSSPITTFSNLQVRRPIFRSSIGRWRRYKNLLTDLFDALGSLAPRELREGEQSHLPKPGCTTNSPDNDASIERQRGA